MDKIRKIIELFANVAIIIVAVLLSVVLIKNYLFRTPSAKSGNNIQVPSIEVQRGEKVNLPDIDWQRNGQTLLLALSTTCHFCSESAPFYQHLMEERGNKTRIIAVLPQPATESKGYLTRLGVSVDDVKQASLDSVGVRYTPTLILADSNGRILDTWVGKLPSTEETKVINWVREHTAQK